MTLDGQLEPHWRDLVAKYTDGRSVLDLGPGDVDAGRPWSVVTVRGSARLVEAQRIARDAIFLCCADRRGILEALVGSGRPHACWQHRPGLLPWRVSEFEEDSADYAAWIWLADPLLHDDEPRVELWNELTEEPAFIDRANAVRAEAARVVEELVGNGCRSLLEVGPGPGYDYRDFLCRIPNLAYSAYEISSAMRLIFLRAAPGVDVRVGSFLDLAPASADIVYTKSTLEHQRDFRDAVRRMVQAARRCVLVSWYLPPEDKELIRPGDRGIYYNVYSQPRVIGFLRSLGLSADIRTGDGSRNELWVIRKG